MEQFENSLDFTKGNEKRTEPAETSEMSLDAAKEFMKSLPSDLPLEKLQDRVFKLNPALEAKYKEAKRVIDEENGPFYH